MRTGVTVAMALSFCVLAVAASTAETPWQTVRAAGDATITIDIPAAVKQETKLDPKSGTLMEFHSLSATTGEGFQCLLVRGRYSKKMTRKDWTARLSGSKTGVLCENVEKFKSVSGFSPMASQPTTSNGFSAATCAASFTKSDEKRPGIVTSVMAVAAPKALYTLTCILSDVDQKTAVGSWGSHSQDVTHMQASLRLPDSK